MKKTILTLIAFAFVLSSCESKEEKTDEKKKTTVEISTDGFLDFNNEIVSNVDAAQLILASLAELDDKNVPASEMEIAADAAKNDAKAILNNIQALAPLGKGGPEYHTAAIAFMNEVINLSQVYRDFAVTLSITEGEWNELQVQEWLNLAEPVFLDYQDSFKYLGTMQGNYAAYQNIEINPMAPEEEEEIISEEVVI